MSNKLTDPIARVEPSCDGFGNWSVVVRDQDISRWNNKQMAFIVCDQINLIVAAREKGLRDLARELAKTVEHSRLLDPDCFLGDKPKISRLLLEAKAQGVL